MEDRMNEIKPKKRQRILRIVMAVFVGIVFAFLFALVFGLLLKVLWNALMPAIFGLTTITYWQAVGLVLMSKLLFCSFGHHHSRHNSDHFHKKTDQKWHKLIGVDNDETDEELWEPKGSHKNWQHYKRYWQEEGKAAFEAYIKKIEAEKPDKKKEE